MSYLCNVDKENKTLTTMKQTLKTLENLGVTVRTVVTKGHKDYKWCVDNFGFDFKKCYELTDSISNRETGCLLESLGIEYYYTEEKYCDVYYLVEK